MLNESFSISTICELLSFRQYTSPNDVHGHLHVITTLLHGMKTIAYIYVSIYIDKYLSLMLLSFAFACRNLLSGLAVHVYLYICVSNGLSLLSSQSKCVLCSGRILWSPQLAYKFEVAIIYVMSLPYDWCPCNIVPGHTAMTWLSCKNDTCSPTQSSLPSQSTWLKCQESHPLSNLVYIAPVFVGQFPRRPARITHNKPWPCGQQPPSGLPYSPIVAQ